MPKGARLGAFLVSIIRSLSGYPGRSFEGIGVLRQAPQRGGRWLILPLLVKPIAGASQAFALARRAPLL